MTTQPICQLRNKSYEYQPAYKEEPGQKFPPAQHKVVNIGLGDQD